MHSQMAPVDLVVMGYQTKGHLRKFRAQATSVHGDPFFFYRNSCTKRQLFKSLHLFLDYKSLYQICAFHDLSSILILILFLKVGYLISSESDHWAFALEGTVTTSYTLCYTCALGFV